jgi:hypothetical protein
LTPIRSVYRMPPPLSGGGFLRTRDLVDRMPCAGLEVGHNGHEK